MSITIIPVRTIRRLEVRVSSPEAGAREVVAELVVTKFPGAKPYYEIKRIDGSSKALDASLREKIIDYYEAWQKQRKGEDK